MDVSNPDRTASDQVVRAVNVEEAARQLNLGRSLTFGLVRSGALRSLKVGGRRIVPVAALDEFLSQQQTTEDRVPGLLKEGGIDAKSECGTSRPAGTARSQN